GAARRPRPVIANVDEERLRSVRKQPRPAASARVTPNKIVAIGISTGGPNALLYLLSQLPADFPASILIVQHMPEGFTEMLARRLDEACEIRVKEASSGDALRAGTALICPGNRHMRLIRRVDGSFGVAV